MGQRPRDSQRNKVEQALDAFERGLSLIDPPVVLHDRIQRSAWWKKRQRPAPGVRPSQLHVLRAYAYAMLHQDVAWHGPEFCRAMLDLTERFLGKAEKQRLMAEFKAHKCKTQTWSPEARARAAERAKGREPGFAKWHQNKHEEALNGVLNILKDLTGARRDND